MHRINGTMNRSKVVWLGSWLVALISAQASDIAISRDGSRVVIPFAGTLESADQLSGPWLALTNVANPFVEEASKARRFYRSREAGSIFSGRSVVNWTLTGPFQTNF